MLVSYTGQIEHQHATIEAALLSKLPIVIENKSHCKALILI